MKKGRLMMHKHTSPSAPSGDSTVDHKRTRVPVASKVDVHGYWTDCNGAV